MGSCGGCCAGVRAAAARPLTHMSGRHRPKTVAAMARKVNKQGQEPEMILSAVSMFKLVQVLVFSAWYALRFGAALPPVLPDALLVLAASVTFAVGQMLNLLVWARIGKDGVCYGVKFGRQVPWCTKFPFTVLNHPQYTGAVLTVGVAPARRPSSPPGSQVWGMFVLLAPSASDWYVIPVVETLLYLSSMFVLEADVEMPDTLRRLLGRAQDKARTH
jgi:hypothetical protein